MWVPYFNDDCEWSRYRAEMISWEGTPYRHLWKSKGRGADCTLYIGAGWKEVGILTDITYDYYSRDWHIHQPTEFVLENLYRHFRNHSAEGIDIIKIACREASHFVRGDLLTFSLTPTGVTNHATVWFGDFPETRERKQMYNSINIRGVCRLTYGRFWEERLTNIFRVMREI